MSKNVLIISSTPRKNGNSQLLSEAFLKGALEAGYNGEIITLKDKRIEFCTGCLSCLKTQKCFINDDTIPIVEKMKSAQVIVFATPVYYYQMCGQLKTMLDRANPLFTADYAFGDIYLIATAADSSKSALDGTIKGIDGWVECFKTAKLKGVVYGVGADAPGDVNNTPAINEAYEMGKNV